MKRTLLFALLLLAVVACSKFDDSVIWDKLNSHEDRILKLETLCNQMNTNIASLQTIIIALQSNDYVVSIAPIKEGNKEIGYTVTFSKSGSITIYHGNDGEDGQDGSNGADGKDGQDGQDGVNGQDGYTPKIGVKQHDDGKYYWTLDDNWLLDDNGNMVPATGEDGKDGANGSDGKDGEDGKDGIIPQLKIENGYWYMSNDNGLSWHQLGVAVDETTRVFASVECDENYLRLTLLDGTQITLPIKKDLTLLLSSNSLKCFKGMTYSVTYYISVSEENARVSAISEGGYTTTVSKTDEVSGEINIKINENSINGKVLVFLTSENQTIVQTIEIFLIDAINLSEDGSANSYIVSQEGIYKLSTVKGNSTESVGAVASAEVLWESFGTDVTPNVGDLVKNVSYNNGEVTFQTAETFKEGNAVIAAKDASGTILWSWHIWLTDEPQGQVYYNNAGTMMDRNLGATSATPGDVGVLGLLYQWGRKDPFLGSSSINNSTLAKSTGTWPSAVSSNSTNGTIEYATAYPTTFIIYNSSNYDWYYTGSSTTDNTRWTTSTATKSIYDPCPSGWRVPDGGNNGIWSKALGSSSVFHDSLLYDITNEGMNFSGKFGSASTIWYPASGCRKNYDGGLSDVGYDGYYCSASPYSYYAYVLSFHSYGYVNLSDDYYRAGGKSVRCLQE